MNTAGTSVIPELPVMRVVKSEIRNFRLELRSRDPKFEMEERSSLPAFQPPSRGCKLIWAQVNEGNNVPLLTLLNLTGKVF